MAKLTHKEVDAEVLKALEPKRPASGSELLAKLLALAKGKA